MQLQGCERIDSLTEELHQDVSSHLAHLVSVIISVLFHQFLVIRLQLFVPCVPEILLVQQQ